MREIERRYQLRHWPPAHLLGPGALLHQGYLLTRPVEIRLRRGPTTQVLTLKTRAATGARWEGEIRIPRWLLDQLWRFVGPRTLTKIRFPVMSDAGTMTFDRHLDQYDGLLILECEFPSTKAAAAFTLPPWATQAIEVTHNPRYQSCTMACASTPAISITHVFSDFS